MEQHKYTQGEIDERIHRNIKGYCCVEPAAIETGKALRAFDALARRASSYELHMHKSEYAFLFSRLVCGIRPDRETGRYESETVDHVAGLTDWFISKKEPTDSLYRARIKDTIRLMKEKKMPVAAEKYSAWEQQLAPKRPRTCIRPILMDPDLIHYTAHSDGRVRRKSRDIEK